MSLTTNISASKHCYACGNSQYRVDLCFHTKTFKTYCKYPSKCDNPEFLPDPDECIEVKSRDLQKHLYSLDSDVRKYFERMIGRSQAVRLSPAQLHYLVRYALHSGAESINEVIKSIIDDTINAIPLDHVTLDYIPFERRINGFMHGKTPKPQPEPRYKQEEKPDDIETPFEI